MWMRWARCQLGYLLPELLLARLLEEQDGWAITVLVVLQGSERGGVLLIGIALLGRGIQEGSLQVVVVCSRSDVGR